MHISPTILAEKPLSKSEVAELLEMRLSGIAKCLIWEIPDKQGTGL